MRQCHVDHFLTSLSTTDWEFISDEDVSLETKCYQFNRTLTAHVTSCMPVSFIQQSPRDKP